MKKIKTVKECLIEVRKRIDINDEKEHFICNNIICLYYDTNNIDIDYELAEKARDYFVSKKPNKKQYTSFTKHEYFITKFKDSEAWWNTAQATEDNKVKSLLIVKRRFLNVLIKEL